MVLESFVTLDVSIFGHKLGGLNPIQASSLADKLPVSKRGTVPVVTGDGAEDRRSNAYASSIGA